MNFILGIILWSELSIQLTQCSSGLFQLLIFFSFRLLTYPMLSSRVSSLHVSENMQFRIFKTVYRAVDLLRAITAVTPPYIYLSRLHIPQILIPFFESDITSIHSIEDKNWHLQRQYHIVMLFIECLMRFLLLYCPHSIYNLRKFVDQSYH